MVLLDEWCSFMKGKEQAAGTAVGQLLSVGDEVEDEDSKSSASKDAADSTEAQSPAPAATGETVDLKVFVGCFEHLAKRSPESKEARNKAWNAADPNGNGFCSLAEIDGWVKKHLLDNKMETEAAERLWKLYRPCYIRAFRDAADATEDRQVAGTKSATTDDYVQRKEFRLLCAYLSIYARMFDAFDMIDGGNVGTTAVDDRRMSLEEWLQGFEKVQGHGFVGLEAVQGAVEAEAVFKEIDADGRGMVLLDEWCSFMKGKEQAAGTAVGQLLSVGDEVEDEDSKSSASKDAADSTEAQSPAPAATGETVDLKVFVGCFEHLAKRSPESKEARNKAWNAADPNGNGFCSLAEIDGWVKKHLLDNKMETEAAERLWKLYRPCYIR